MTKDITTFVFLIGFSFLCAQNRVIPVDTLVKTNHNTTVKGQNFSYTAETGTQPVWNKDGDPMATLFYTYYTRDNIKNRAKRAVLTHF